MDAALRYYDGLVCATARRCVAFCEEDYDDVVQVLRVKVWQALRAYDPRRARTDRDRYVFMCVRDRAKDVVKKKKRNQLHIEDLRTVGDRASQTSTTDRFDARYLCSTREENYAAIEDDDDPLAGLDELEREIARMLTADYKQAQVARALGLQKVEMDRAMRSIRFKLAALRPLSANGAGDGAGDDRADQRAERNGHNRLDALAVAPAVFQAEAPAEQRPDDRPHYPASVVAA
jgi:RNA polymerase sigma factor (sigma-70 family)